MNPLKIGAKMRLFSYFHSRVTHSYQCKDIQKGNTRRDENIIHVDNSIIYQHNSKKISHNNR